MTGRAAKPQPTMVDFVDRAAAIEKAQREYASVHNIELTEGEFALAHARAVVSFEHFDGALSEKILVRRAEARIRSVANAAGRRRPLGMSDRVFMWFVPAAAAVLSGLALWSAYDLRSEALTAPYLSWVPSEVSEAVPHYMEWFGLAIAVVGILMTGIAVIAGLSGTLRTQTFQPSQQVAMAAVGVGTIVLLVLVLVATSWLVVLTTTGGGQ